MKIIKNFFDVSKREIEKIEKELEEKKEEKMPEELQAEAEKTRAEGQYLFEKLKMLEQQTVFVHNKEKYENFELLYKGALIVAECLDLNVEISTENTYHATIQFTTENFFLVKDAAQEIHLIVGMLFAFADEAWINWKDGLLNITFFFQINDIVRR